MMTHCACFAGSFVGGAIGGVFAFWLGCRMGRRHRD